MTKRIKNGLVAICLVVPVLAIVGYCWRYSIPLDASDFFKAPSNETQEVPPITVSVVKAKRITSWNSKSYFSGIVNAKRKSVLSFERIGRVDRIFVDKGDRVQAGQTIASLNIESIEAQVRKLEADRQAAIGILDEMRAGPREELIEAARATVRESDAQAEQAKRSLDRRQSLINTDSISREDLDQAQTSLKRMEAARTNAQKTLEDLELGTRKEKIATQQAIIASLQESIVAARIDIEHSSIRSPYAGIIIDRIIHEGVVASPGSPAFVVNEDAELEAFFGIPPSLLDTIQADKPLTLIVRDHVIQAKLKSFVPQVDDETRTMSIVVTIPETDCKKVYPGDIAKLELLRPQTSDGFWLNMEVVMQGQRGLWECYVVEPTESEDMGTVVRRAVEILHTEGDRVLVRGALRSDDLVVSNAASRLVVGQRVRIDERVLE